MMSGPFVPEGMGGGSDPGVTGFEIIGASGRPAVVGTTGRLVREFVPALRPEGEGEGLVAREGATERPEID